MDLGELEQAASLLQARIGALEKKKNVLLVGFHRELDVVRPLHRAVETQREEIMALERRLEDARRELVQREAEKAEKSEYLTKLTSGLEELSEREKRMKEEIEAVRGEIQGRRSGRGVGFGGEEEDESDEITRLFLEEQRREEEEKERRRNKPGESSGSKKG